MRSERVIIAAMSVLSACAESGLVDYVPATFPDGGLLLGARALSAPSLALLQGVYALQGASSGFGTSVLVTATRDTVSILATQNAAYAVGRAGCLEDGRLVIEGYWRHGTGEASGLMRFVVGAAAGGFALCTDSAGEAAFVLNGGFAVDATSLADTAVLTRQRALCRPTRPFFTVAHRGGCRTQDYCGASENSLEIIRLASTLGANGIELDVRLTKEGVAIVYHDESFSPRLTRGRYCLGPVSTFSAAHIATLCQLRYGERVPTLAEALSTAVDDTDLQAVWLDVKEPSAVAPAIEALRAAESLAARNGRQDTIRFAVGIATEEIMAAFLSHGDRAPCLSELDRESTLRAGCTVWAPRWTLGPLPEETAAVQAAGGQVVYWTADEAEFIDVLLENTSLDGLLTNRPGVVRHRFETLLGERCR
ncbi:MAG: hypothetical protein IT384_23145 [Deltaproteobacteria bacterium]|nr:hypothetical protein [Deltaproteobacteria bacterium]